MNLCGFIVFFALTSAGCRIIPLLTRGAKEKHERKSMSLQGLHFETSRKHKKIAISQEKQVQEAIAEASEPSAHVLSRGQARSGALPRAKVLRQSSTVDVLVQAVLDSVGRRRPS